MQQEGHRDHINSKPHATHGENKHKHQLTTHEGECAGSWDWGKYEGESR